MKYSLKETFVVHSVTGEKVTLRAANGSDHERTLIVHSASARALMVAAGKVVVETNVTPAANFTISGDSREADNGGHLAFPTIFVTEHSLRVDGVDIVNKNADTSASQPEEPVVNEPVEFKTVPLETQWQIDRDNAIAEGIGANFMAQFGKDGPNDHYKSYYVAKPALMLAGDLKQVEAAEAAAAETTVPDTTPVQEGTDAEGDGIPEIPATDGDNSTPADSAPSDEPTTPVQEADDASGDGISEVPASSTSSAAAQEPTTTVVDGGSVVQESDSGVPEVPVASSATEATDTDAAQPVVDPTSAVSSASAPAQDTTVDNGATVLVGESSDGVPEVPASVTSALDAPELASSTAQADVKAANPADLPVLNTSASEGAAVQSATDSAAVVTTPVVSGGAVATPDNASAPAADVTSASADNAAGGVSEQAPFPGGDVVSGATSGVVGGTDAAAAPVVGATVDPVVSAIADSAAPVTSAGATTSNVADQNVTSAAH